MLWNPAAQLSSRVPNSLYACEVNYLLVLPLGTFSKLRCPSPRMGDVCHDIIRPFQHPFVAPGDREARVDSFDAFWK